MLGCDCMEPPAEQAEPAESSAAPEQTREAQAEPKAADPFVRRLTTAVLVIVISGLLLSLFILGIDILLAAFAGLLIAVFLRALMSLVQRVVALRDGWALAVVLVVLGAVVGVGGWLLAPQIITQSGHLGEQFVAVAGDVHGYLQGRWWGRWLLARAPMQGAEDVSDAVGGVFVLLSDGATYLLTAVFVGLFVAANAKLYKTGIVRLIPLRHREVVGELLDDLGFTLRWFLIGQLITMTIIGVSVTIVLWAFGLPLAIVVGLIVGALGFIPYLGPYLGLIPVALVALPEGPSKLLYVLLAYTGVQLLEGYVAAPLIQQRVIYLPPALTIIMQILLGVVLGVLGFVLATPIAAVTLVLSRYYRREVLGDPLATAQVAQA
jgi:predicted PurR-regulated permease PerM